MRDLLTATGGQMFIFDSMTEAMGFVDEEQYNLVVDRRDADWIGRRISSFSSLRTMINEPWKDGLEVIEKFAKKLLEKPLPQLKERKRRIKFSDDGDEVDLDRLRAGQEFWRKSSRDDIAGPATVTIVTDLSTNSGVEAKDILWRGAAALAAAKVLEDKGYSTEIWATCGSRLYWQSKNYEKAHQKVMSAFLLKKTSDPLDVSSLSSFVSGWFYRTGVFGVCFTIARNGGNVYQGRMGGANPPLPSDLDSLSTDTNRIYISDTFSFDGALSLLRHSIEKIANHENQ